MERYDAEETGADPGVADWAARMRDSLIEPIDAAVAEYHAALAAQTVQVRTDESTVPSANRHGRLRKRGIVFSGILSTMLAKIMVGVITVAAAAGGVATVAGVDVNPFSGGDAPIAVVADEGVESEGTEGVESEGTEGVESEGTEGVESEGTE
ncbi:MAG: hypothetical protein ABIJ75_07820, partial [Actinomycetota bacterium]